MLTRIQKALNDFNARLVRETAYVTVDDDGGAAYCCCAIGALALAFIEQPRVLLASGRAQIFDALQQRTGMSADQLLAIEGGFEGSYIPVGLLREQYPREYQLGVRLSAMAT